MNKEQWREHGIYNAHELVKRYTADTGQVGIYLAKSANDGSRMNMGVPSGWQVSRPGFVTNPDGHWREHGNKTFHTFSYGDNWDRAREAAAAWATDRYNLRGEFVAIPGFGRDRFPIEIAEWAKTIKPVKHD